MSSTENNVLPYKAWYEPVGPGPGAYNVTGSSFKVSQDKGKGTFGRRTFIRPPGEDPYVYQPKNEAERSKKAAKPVLPELHDPWKKINRKFTFGSRPVQINPDPGMGYSYNHPGTFGKNAQAKSISSRHRIPNSDDSPLMKLVNGEYVRIESKADKADVMKAYMATQPSSPQFTLAGRTFVDKDANPYKPVKEQKTGAPTGTRPTPKIFAAKGPSIGQRYHVKQPDTTPGPGTYEVAPKRQVKADRKHPTIGTRTGFVPVSYLSSRTARLTMLREDVQMNQTRTGDFSFTQ